jgi:diphosphomevalonate decarboxylase
MKPATVRAHSNIAFIKYWGNQDDALRLPVNPSMSMNLDSLYTDTTVQWNTALPSDSLILNGQVTFGKGLERVAQHLDKIRQRLGIDAAAQVASQNNFPMGAGIASSASAFAALAMAAVAAAEVKLAERELSTLARLGSGSAARSIPAGFVEWHTGRVHAESFAETVAAPDYWDLVDVIAIVSDEHKHTTSQAGHPTAKTSDLQIARVAGAIERLQICKQAILARDFPTFAEVVEHDSNLMHAVMMTSKPPLFYWKPTTLTIMDCVRQWRSEGLAVCYTLDAGPNVHCICISEDAATVRNRLQSLSGVVDVRAARPGGAAQLLD